MSKSPKVWAQRITADYAARGRMVPMAAFAYVAPMLTLDTLEEMYYADDARSVCLYALSNLSGWRGDEAKAVKAEMRQALGLK